MKAYVKTEVMQAATAVASKFVSARSPIQDYQTIRVKVLEDKIQVSAETPEHAFAKCEIAHTKTDACFQFDVDGKTFQGAIASVRGEDMAISLEGSTAVVGFAGGKLKIPVKVVAISIAEHNFGKPLSEMSFDQPELKSILAYAKTAERNDVGTCGLVFYEDKACVFGTDDAMGRAPTRFALIEMAEAEKFEPFYFRHENMSRAISACPGATLSLANHGGMSILKSSDETMSVVTGFGNEQTGRFRGDQFKQLTKTEFSKVVAGDFFAACKQLGVVKLPEHCGASMALREKDISLSLGTSSGESSAVIPCEGSVIQDAKIDVESLVDVSRCFDAAESIRIGFGSRSDGVLTGLVLKSENVTILSAVMENS